MRMKRLFFFAAAILIAPIVAACGGEEIVERIVVQTVVVEKLIAGEKVVETVIVEKVVAGEKVVETVIVEKRVAGEKVVETVIVEKIVAGEKVIETVVVERIVVATAAPVVAKQSGTLRVGVSSITPGVFRPSLLKWPVNLDKVAWGVADPITYHPHVAPILGEVTTEALAESWVVDPDGNSVTFKLRKGVEFHDGWGELTADDVVYTFDDALFSEGTLAKIAESRTWMDRWVKVDKYTVTMTTREGEQIPPLWGRTLSNQGQIGGIWSKKVFDDLGPDKAAETPVGTGPFSVEKWIANEEVILNAQERHYRETPKIKKVIIREIPEEATRLAAFRAGEIDITPVSLRFVGSLLGETGGHAVETNAPSRIVVWYGGNFWAKKDLLTGEAVPRREGFLPDDDHPWIGDPDNPANFERAAKVRKAMSMAIDRDAINEKILLGIGQVGPNTWYNFSPDDPEWKEEWRDEFKFDADGARALLAEAGFPGGGFSIDFFVTPDLPTIVDPQVGQAIAQMWQDNLGIKVNIDSTAYSAKRPSLVARSFPGAYIWVYGSPGVDEPQIYGQRPSKGWNPAVEITFADNTWFKIRAELDSQVRRDANAEAQQYLSDLRWNTILVKTPKFAAVSKNVEWVPTTLNGVSAGDFERVIIR